MAEPTRLRKQLGAELRGARTLGAVTQRTLAVELATSQATIARIENGEGALLSRARTVDLLDACAATPETRNRVLALTEAAHSETWRWDDPLGGDTKHLQGIAGGRETGARTVRSFTNTAVHGLMQTAEYARLLLPQADPTGAMDYPAAVAARMQRQQVLYGTGRQFFFLIEEHVLSWAPGPDVMAAQRDRLVSLATLASVTIAVLPDAREGGFPWHGFTLYGPDDGSTYATTEMLHGGQVVTDPEQVAAYEVMWTRLWDAALVGADAAKRIRSFDEA